MKPSPPPTTLAPEQTINEITLSLDCTNTSSTLTGGVPALVDVAGKVIATPTLTDLSGIELSIELDPSNQFTQTSIPVTFLTATTDSQGNFFVTSPLNDIDAVLCPVLGYEIAITGTNVHF